MVKKIVNLTPHCITFVGPDGGTTNVEPSGTVARIDVETKTIGNINGIPVTKSAFGDVTGLPDPVEDTIFIVSSIVASRCDGRDDVFIPNDSVRDDAGRIIGCRSLGRI